MMRDEFHYSVGARARAPRLILIGLLLGVVGGMFVMYFWWTIILGVVGGIFALVGAVFFFGGFVRLIAGGEWSITVNDAGIDWHAPFASEVSFQYPFTEIDRIERRIREKHRANGTTQTRIKHALYARDGRRHRLSSQSGVDVKALVDVLVQRGVKVDEVNATKNRPDSV